MLGKRVKDWLAWSVLVIAVIAVSLVMAYGLVYTITLIVRLVRG
jgi:hypothetical protein